MNCKKLQYIECVYRMQFIECVILSAAGMACTGFFWCPGGWGVHSCSCLRYLAPLWVPGDAAWTVLVAYWDLLGFPLHIDVWVFGLPDVVRELLIGLCSVLLSYILTTAVSGVVCWCRTILILAPTRRISAFSPSLLRSWGITALLLWIDDQTIVFFLYIGYFRLPSGPFPLKPKWYHYTNTSLWIHIPFWLSDQLHNPMPILNASFQLFHGLQIHCLVWRNWFPLVNYGIRFI